MKKLLLLIVALIATNSMAAEPVAIEPRRYACSYTKEAVVVDGQIDDKVWQQAAWTENFVDIRGYDYSPAPKFATRAKMLYDDKYLYIAFEMMEPHLWGTLVERDATIYYDNDIEVFIDPDGDSKNYEEYEFNVLGTEWDLLLTKPQARGGVHINGWDLKGMKTAVKTYGTVNDPSDVDEKWTFEIAMPIAGILQPSVNKYTPIEEQTWRINFSRVEWLKYEIVDGKYRKIKGSERFGNEENWVWSPTGAVDMHRPELWGYLTFLK